MWKYFKRPILFETADMDIETDKIYAITLSLLLLCEKFHLNVDFLFSLSTFGFLLLLTLKMCVVLIFHSADSVASLGSSCEVSTFVVSVLSSVDEITFSPSTTSLSTTAVTVGTSTSLLFSIGSLAFVSCT